MIETGVKCSEDGRPESQKAYLLTTIRRSTRRLGTHHSNAGSPTILTPLSPANHCIEVLLEQQHLEGKAALME